MVFIKTIDRPDRIPDNSEKFLTLMWKRANMILITGDVVVTSIHLRAGFFKPGQFWFRLQSKRLFMVPGAWLFDG